MIRVSSNGGSMKESKQSFTQCIHSGALQTSDLIMHTHKRTEWPRPRSLLALTGQINLRVCRRNIHTHSYTAAWALAVQLIRKRDKRVECLNEGGVTGQRLRAFSFTWNDTAFLCFDISLQKRFLCLKRRCTCMLCKMLHYKEKAHWLFAIITICFTIGSVMQ